MLHIKWAQVFTCALLFVCPERRPFGWYRSEWGGASLDALVLHPGNQKARKISCPLIAPPPEGGEDLK